MRYLILLAALLSPVAYSATLTVSWNAPTTNTDGSNIPATGAGSIASTRVEWGSCNGTAFGTKAGEVVVNAPALTTTIPNVTAGTTVCTRAFAMNTFGSESGASNVASKAIPAPIPNPPTGLTAVAGIAYMATRQNDRYVMVPVGTVPGSTVCDTSNAVISAGAVYYAVPHGSVTWYGSTKPTVVMATCS